MGGHKAIPKENGISRHSIEALVARPDKEDHGASTQRWVSAPSHFGSDNLIYSQTISPARVVQRFVNDGGGTPLGENKSSSGWLSDQIFLSDRLIGMQQTHLRDHEAWRGWHWFSLSRFLAPFPHL